MRYLVAGICAALLVGLFITSSEPLTGGEKELKNIKDVMKYAHAGAAKSLRAKVLAGKASDEEKKNLVAAYEVLAKSKSPTGKDEAWQGLTKKILEAAKAGDNKALEKLTNCAACHKEHKPK